MPLSQDVLYDRLLGCLLGSAIGDAMGAPVEMWPRDRIQAEHGHITGLLPPMRLPSPEGTWGHNLPAGSSTDDTRWKALLTDFLAGPADAPRTRPEQLDPAECARLIAQRHDAALLKLQALPSPDADQVEQGLHRVQWLQEWHKVATAYLTGDVAQYGQAQSQFYGGEMVCGGMLFAPLIGAVYPGKPDQAYRQAFALNIYDLGYARDIAALTAALTSVAMQPTPTLEQLWAVLQQVDPFGYAQSRLVGRTAYEWYRLAQQIVWKAKQVDVVETMGAPPVPLAMPTATHADRRRYAQWSTAYAALDAHLQRMPFHPGEIWLVCLTGMLLCKLDFPQTLAFIVNFGRDNDTTAAVAGAILGALHGAKALPEELVSPTLSANLALDIDLKDMAQRLLVSMP